MAPAAAAGAPPSLGGPGNRASGPPTAGAPAPKPEQAAQIFFGNLTAWGLQAANFCRNAGFKYHLIALAETHVDANGITEQSGKLAMGDWKLSATPAVATNKSDKGTRGGEWVLTRRDVAATTFEGYRDYYVKRHKRQPFVGFTPTVLHSKSGDIVVLAACLRLGLRDQGANRDILVSISTFVDMLMDPWIILADWNYEPHWWGDKPWLTRWNGTVLTDPSCEATCDKGSGSVYDCAIVRADIATHVGIEAIYDAPWKTHCGIQVAVGTAEPWQYKATTVPKALPARARPKKVADPSSKRSKARAEALRTRRERLPEHLRDEFDALYINRETANQDPAPFVIPQQNWDAAANEVRNFPKFDGAKVGTKEGRGHIFHNHAPNLAENINPKHAQWIATLELAVLETHAVPGEDRARYQGRAEGCRTTKQTMKASPGRAYLKDPEATCWQHLSTLVARYTALVTNGKGPKARQHIHKTEHFGRITDPQEIEEWKTQLVTLEYCDVADLHRISATTMEWTHKAMARAAGRARKRYLDWAKQAWKDSPVKLHRMVTDHKTPRLEGKQPQRTVGDPSTLMNRSAGTWRSTWASDSYNAKQIISACEKAMRLAKEDHLPLIEPQHIQAIVGTANPKKVQLYLAPRCLRMHGWVSDIIDAERATVVASSQTIAYAVHDGLKKKGHHVKVANSAVDLGIDVGGAKRRVVVKAIKRARTARRRTHRIIAKVRKHASLAKIAKGLWNTGSRRQSIAEWLNFWMQFPEHHRRATLAWKLIYDKSIKRGNTKWRKVKGPISAIQAILLDAGWTCPTPTEWSRPPWAGETYTQEWQLPHSGQADWGDKRYDVYPAELAHEFCLSLEGGLWRDAAKHPHGEGLQRGGLDVRIVANEMERFTRKGQYDQSTPWVAERPSQAKGPRLTKLQLAMQSSQHAFELRAGKYLCSRCGLTTDKCKVRQACATPCTHQPPLPSASDQIVPVQGTITIAGRELHASHKLHFMQKYRLYFCRGCGKTATEEQKKLKRLLINSGRTHSAAPMAVACAVPARAVRLRLQQATAEPSWAVYLPTAAWRSRLTLWADEPFEQGHCFDGAAEARPLQGPGRAEAPAGPARARRPRLSEQRPVGRWVGRLRAEAAALSEQRAEARRTAPSSAGTSFKTICALFAALLLIVYCTGCGSALVSLISAKRKVKAHTVESANMTAEERFFKLVAPRRARQGCRRVQQALDDARGPEACGRLAAELRGHVWDALRCPHANFVLQKCITTASPDACQFIVDELLQRGHGALAQAARHRYGCRIVERLLERCRPEQVEQIVDCILDDAVTLCMHPYGNYVAQHLLEHAAPASAGIASPRWRRWMGCIAARRRRSQRFAWQGPHRFVAQRNKKC
ncbi:unnamed protein product [Prorocentrum cordatum]|uniref:PUM-HD domain-containing protein n=1 Tax=Prorocentrum cordatum TaxID=2364126 RepID=A0ABN9X1H7_9DINO|nr:unnamed protein product [Polarella glacialis]